MNEIKKSVKSIFDRIENARFFQLFIVDDEGIGYLSGPMGKGKKRGVAKQEIEGLITRMGKEIIYLNSIIEDNKTQGMVS